MFGPTPIEFSTLCIGQLERAFTLRIREAFPKGDGEFRAIPSRKLKELGKWAGCHIVIVSRVDLARNIHEIRVVLVVSGIRVICLDLHSAV